MNIINCEMCGSNRLIKTDGVYQCEFCGTKYTPEEAKKLIVSGTVEVIKGNAEKERLLHNANDFINIGDFDNAYNVYQQITDQYPGDYIGWAKLAEFPFIKAQKTSTNPSVSSLLQSIEYERRAKIYNDNYTLTNEWVSLVNKHKKLNIVNILVRSKYNYYETILDAFDSDLICCDTDKLNTYLAKIQSLLTDEYCKRLLDGEMGLFQTNRSFSGIEPFRLSNIWGDDSISSSYIDDDLPYKNKSMNALFIQGKHLAEKLRNSFSNSLNSKKNFLSEVFESNVSYLEKVFILFIIGKNVVYSCYDSIYVERLKYSITEQSINTVLQKNNIHLYSSEEKSKAEIFIKNFLNNATNKTNLIESLSRKFCKNEFQFKAVKGNTCQTVVSITQISFSPSISISFTKNVKYNHPTFTRSQTGQIWINDYGIIDVFNFLQEYNKTNRCRLCPNCGCQYKGIFNKVCSGCGH